MPKQTKQQQIDELERTLRIEQEGIQRLRQENEILKCKLSQFYATERRFDQLLEAMSMGMREANLPRRPA